MAATASGTKTVTKSLAPHLSAALLTTLLATPVETLTLAQFMILRDALNRVSGSDPSTKIGALLN